MTTMSRILLTGIATLDIVNSVSHYPAEDEEIRASSQNRLRGGNAANTACVLAQFDHQVEFLSVLADDNEADLIRQDLQHYCVGYQYCPVKKGKTPTSYIVLNQQNGSRTIVHHRDLPELDSAQFLKLPLEQFDWYHFEARNVTDCYIMMSICQQRRVDQTISLEIEKDRDNIDTLLPMADILFFSQAFVKSRGFSQAEAFIQHIQPTCPQSMIICAWGEEGAYAHDGKQPYHCAATKLEQVVDTIGAGDTFNAGVINALAGGIPLGIALQQACQLAEKKLTQTGFDNLA